MAAASIAVLGLAVPALAQAQDAAPTGAYGTLGYSHLNPGDADLGAIQGRLGYRFNNYLGAEGELATGIQNDRQTVAPGVDAKVKLDHQEAIYGVGFLPINPQLDLLGRVGYGHTEATASALGQEVSVGGDSWNYGAGVQYHLDGKNGIRADYTRQEFQRSGGGSSDNWSVAYNRRF